MRNKLIVTVALGVLVGCGNSDTQEPVSAKPAAETESRQQNDTVTAGLSERGRNETGDACSSRTSCPYPNEQVCVFFDLDRELYSESKCVAQTEQDYCALVECATGKHCMVDESAPPVVYCGN